MTSPPDQDKKVPLRIRLPFSTEAEFTERYGVNVARGGIFIATRATKPLGTLLSFEIILQDGQRLMRGEGVVERASQDEAPGKNGMLVRFTRIDARTKELIDRMLALRLGATNAAPPETSTPPPRREEPPAPIQKPKAAKKGPVPLAEDVVLGIDLGTTTCRAAVWVEGSPRLVTIPTERGYALPSLVAWDAARGKLLVGGDARKYRVDHPDSSVSGLKRLIGRRARSRRVRELVPRIPFPLVPDMEGDVGVELGGRVYTLPELAAELLSAMKHAAQEMLGRELTRAVVCVPAWYSDHQRGAMLEAGRLAGLEVLRVLNEPSAVALAYGYGKGLARKRVLVYDFGGGTFDASVVEITGDDLEVVSTGGDNFLGGIDFDERLATHLVSTLTSDVQSAVNDSRVTWERVRDAAEVAKISLSDKDSAPVFLPFIAPSDGGAPADLKADVARPTLEQLTADLVDRTAEVTRVVLETAGLTAQHLDEVLLVGGQSRAPAVRRRMETQLGRVTRTDIDPQGAVALGAAILGHSIVQREKGKQGITLSEVLSAPIGVAVRGGGMRRILERNTRLPAEKTLALPVSAGQLMKIAVFQGLSTRAEDNEYLGALTATCERAGDMALRFVVTADGRLSLSAMSPQGRQLDAAFATAEASDDLQAQLFADSPLPGEEDPQDKGFISGIRRLFGR